MKKLLLACLIAALCSTVVFAESLGENEYYKKATELQAQAQAAFDEGDYDSAADYAAQAQEYARQSDEYVARMLAKKSADDSLAAAQARYDWAVGVRLEVRNPSLFADATTELAWARSDYEAEAYADAKTKADGVLAMLAGVTEEQPLPAFFVVRKLESLEDCYWRIAGMPFVYNDPWQWKVLYKANKKAMPDPANPDLILPGMIITIPSLKGELREGTWDEADKYPTFGAEN